MAVEIVLPVRTIGLLLLLSLTVVAVSLAYIYLPRASIALYPATHVKEAEQTIVLSTEAKEPDFVRYILPARLIQHEITEKQTFTRTNEGGSVSEDFAKGVITLRNEQSEEQNLLPQTHLRHEATGIFFLTDNAVKIPAQSEVQVSVTAKERGTSGNAAAGRFIVDKLPASLQQAVYGQSSQPLTGGLATEQTVSEQELSEARTKTIEAAKQRVVGELTLQAGGAHIDPNLVTVSPTAEHISAQPGSRTTDFTVEVTVQARGFVVDENDMLSLTLLALRSGIPSDEEFVSYDPGSFDLTIDRADFERGEIRVTGKLQGLFARKISPSSLRAS
ncbi:MAG: hypothetical protein WEC84_00405, partial [Candidatus Andersenbacteria bacterium]